MSPCLHFTISVPPVHCRCDCLFVSLQVYSVLSYSSVQSLDQSGQRPVDSAHLHLLHLVTVAHMVQVLLTSTIGD